MTRVERVTDTEYEERSDDGWQLRTRLTVGGLLDMEGLYERLGDDISPIRVAHEWWRAGGSLNDQFCYFDVSDPNPMNFAMYNHHGNAWPIDDGTPLHKYPIADHARRCAFEYLRCREAQKPQAHYIQQKMNGVTREYVRLMLPLAAASGDVGIVAYAFRHLKPAHFPSSLGIPSPTKTPR